MTIFDYIKYPISVPVTNREMTAMPDDLRAKCFFAVIHPLTLNSDEMARIMRKIILEYNGDNEE